MKPVIVVFAKTGPVGAVKTRLIPALGAAGAARVNRLLAQTTVQRAVAWAERVHLAVTPGSTAPGLPALPCLPQGEGDLGDRLIRVTEQLLPECPDGLIILGTDSPDLPFDRLDLAAAALAAGCPAICPGHDGGYSLVAVPRSMPALFRGIDWGTERVAEQTRQAAAEAGYALREMPAWRDVDTFEDLAALLGRLAGSEEASLLELHDGLLWTKLDGEQESSA